MYISIMSKVPTTFTLTTLNAFLSAFLYLKRKDLAFFH